MLHDTVEGVEEEAGSEVTEWVSCDEAEKSRLEGDRGSSPSLYLQCSASTVMVGSSAYNGPLRPLLVTGKPVQR